MDLWLPLPHWSGVVPGGGGPLVDIAPPRRSQELRLQMTGEDVRAARHDVGWGFLGRKQMIRGLEPGRRTALLISECQRGVIEPGRSIFSGLADEVASRKIVGRIARLAHAFRTMGAPVVHAHFVHLPNKADLPPTNPIMAASIKQRRLMAGSDDVEPVLELPVVPGDVVNCRNFSLIAFHGTELDMRLRNMGIQTVVLTGVSTNVAISGMAVCASDLGYNVVVPEDCIAGASAETHAFIVRHLLPLYSTVTSSADVLATLFPQT